MCKYCIEGHIYSEIEYELGFGGEDRWSHFDGYDKSFFSEKECLFELADDLTIVVYAIVLQEVDDVDKSFMIARTHSYSHRMADIMFCKAIEMCIVGGSNYMLDRLADDIGREEYTLRINEMMSVLLGTPFDGESFLDVLSRDETINLARSILQSYAKKPYIKGGDQWLKYYDEFSAVYASLCILIKNKVCDDVIEKIIVDDTGRINSFYGFDLWLERMAVLHSIRCKGVKFIADNYDKMRYDVVHYSVLKYKYEYEEINELKKIIVRNKAHGHCVKRKDTLKLIENIKNKLAGN